MGLEDIKEVKECEKQDEVNGLLNQGNWRLIEVKIEKLRIPVGKEIVGMDSAGGSLDYTMKNRYEIKYEDKLAAFYVVGRY